MQEENSARAPALLERDETCTAWRGCDEVVDIIIHYDAFERYVHAYLAVHDGVSRRDAEMAVRRLSYWHDYMAYENDVHVKRLQPRGGGINVW